MVTIESELRSFIAEELLLGRAVDLSLGTSFLENGIIDSTGVLELVQFVEDRWAINVADDEMIPENLDSLHGLVHFIERKLSAVDAAASTKRRSTALG